MIERLTQPCERPKTEEEKKGYVHPWPNRILHWTHAALIVLLLWTGFQIAFPGVNLLWGVANAVVWHKVFGILLLIQMPVWLGYRIASGRITRRCIPCWCDFWACSLRQIKFYLFEIFVGRPHPYDPRELNPMQRVTYVTIMLVLLPVAMLSGAVLLWPEALSLLTNWLGIRVWQGIHLVAAYGFLLFVLLHVYLATTGEKPWSYYKAMITGWVDKEEIEAFERLQKQKEVEDA